MLGLPFIQPQIVAFKVVEIEPAEAVIITKNTSIEFSDKPAARIRRDQALLVRGYRRAQGRAPAAPRDDRAAAPPPGTLPEARDRAAQGRPSLWAAGHRENPDRKGCCKRERCALHLDCRPRGHLEILRGERTAAPRGLRGGPGERALDHLHRRTRLHCPPARGSDRGSGAPGRRPAPDNDGRA